MNKADKYTTIFQTIQALVEGESDIIANMANMSALLHEEFGFWWTGFYRVEQESDQLVLGPFQGPVACTRIPFGKGVCGTAWERAESVIVPDIHKFPGHIACSSASNSEIVVPVFQGKKVIAVLDIDSTEFNTFDQTDKEWLEKIVSLIG
ncbi:MAG: GAF domain-containing protein [Bacteroidales bacterium]|nr:GAF domain-containing protein [Bacteroidales bacterium]